MYIPDQAFLHKIAYIFIYSTTSNDFLFYFLIFLRCSKNFIQCILYFTIHYYEEKKEPAHPEVTHINAILIIS